MDPAESQPGSSRTLRDVSDEPPPGQVPVRLVVPDELKVGTYANFMTIWNNGPHDFTLDFAVVGMGQQSDEGPFVPLDLVARVKVAPSIVFQIAQAIAEHVDLYEQKFGTITPRPPDTSPTFPPEEP